MVEAKAVAGANLEKVNQIREIQVAGETSLEAGGAKEDMAEALDRNQGMIIDNFTLVV